MNTPYSKITEHEHEMLRSYIKCYAQSDNTEMSGTYLADNDVIFKEWDSAKSTFLFKLFGEELILQKTVNVAYTLQEKTNILLNKLEESEDAWSYYNWLRDCGNTKNWFEKPNYIIPEYGHNSIIKCAWYEMVNIETITTNIWTKDTVYFELSNGKKIKIEKGGKISKFFSTLNKYYPHDCYDKFRCVCSEMGSYITQEFTVNLSIHPLDYLTMSDNQEDWESCMNWTCGGGEYRAGTVEMMNSPCVAVAYIASKNNYLDSDYLSLTMDDFKWNSKRWRSLFILDPYFARNISEYPYNNELLVKEIFLWLKELYINAGYNNIESFIAKDTPTVAGPYGLQQNSIFITNLMYNDTVHRAGYYVGELPTAPYMYSGKLTCIWCGQERTDGKEMLVCCPNCEMVECCENCGSTYGEFYTDPETNETLCSDCYYERFFYCESCCSDINRNNSKQYELSVYYSSKEGVKWRNLYTCKKLCEDCFNELVDKLKKINIELSYSEEDDFYYIFYNDINPEAQDILDF